MKNLLIPLFAATLLNSSCASTPETSRGSQDLVISKFCKSHLDAEYHRKSFSNEEFSKVYALKGVNGHGANSICGDNVYFVLSKDHPNINRSYEEEKYFFYHQNDLSRSYRPYQVISKGKLLNYLSIMSDESKSSDEFAMDKPYSYEKTFEYESFKGILKSEAKKKRKAQLQREIIKGVRDLLIKKRKSGAVQDYLSSHVFKTISAGRARNLLKTAEMRISKMDIEPWRIFEQGSAWEYSIEKYGQYSVEEMYKDKETQNLLFELMIVELMVLDIQRLDKSKIKIKVTFDPQQLLHVLRH